MKILLAFLLCLACLHPATAQAQPSPKAPKPVLLARFEVTKEAFNLRPAPPRSALLLYLVDRNIESVRVNGKDEQTRGLGTLASLRLMRRLDKLDLPKIDYQKYFDDLAKQPRKAGKEWIDALDGQQVEVKMDIQGTVIRFKMWNPGTFFTNHDDDEIASKVNAAVEAIIIVLGKSAVYF